MYWAFRISCCGPPGLVIVALSAPLVVVSSAMRFSYSQDSAPIRQIKRFRGTVGLCWVDLQRRFIWHVEPGHGFGEAPMCDQSDVRPSLTCDAVQFGLPVTDHAHPGRRLPSASPTALVVALPAPYLTFSRCEGRVAVLPGQ